MWIIFLDLLTNKLIFYIVHYNTNVLDNLERRISLIFNTQSTMPIYMQVAEWIENEILADRLLPEGKVYSQYQLAEIFNINPATAGKGLTILVEKEILYKKRGLGMFVIGDAKHRILTTRRSDTLTKMAKEIVEEAKRLGVMDEDLIELIKHIQKEG